MMDNLIERLNERTFKRVGIVDDRMVMVPCLAGHPDAEDCLINPDGPEAASTIESLQAENGRLREALKVTVSEFESDFAIEGVIVDDPPKTFVIAYKSALAALSQPMVEGE